MDDNKNCVLTWNCGHNTEFSKRKDSQVVTHEIVVATQTLGDQKKLSRRESKWLATETVLRQRNLVVTHNSAKEEKARSQHGIVVATQISENKKMWSQQESSLLATKHGHEAAIQVAIAT